MDGKRERERSFFFLFFLPFFLSFFLLFSAIPDRFSRFRFSACRFSIRHLRCCRRYFDEVDRNSEITYNFCCFGNRDRLDWLYFQSLQKKYKK